MLTIYLLSGLLSLSYYFTPDEENQCEYLPYRNHTSWIGYTDEVTEGNWKWVDPAISSNYTNWHPKGGVWKQAEPNGGRNENCATIGGPLSWGKKDWEGYWNDARCSAKAPFICKRINTG